MIAFVVPVADRERYDAIAAPGIERVREPDSIVLPLFGEGPPQPRVNAALDRLADVADLEAVIVVHEDVRLTGLDTASRIRVALADPEVAIVGAIGAVGVRSIAWWKGLGFGRVSTTLVPGDAVTGHADRGPVDALDGVVLCLGPWAVRTLRFDERLADDFHGYDVDLCFQARYHGRRVEVLPLEVHHEHAVRFTGTDRWVRNALRFEQIWIARRPISARRHRQVSPAAVSEPSA